MKKALENADFISYIQEKVLNSCISLRTDIFSSASMAFLEESHQKYFCEVYQPADDLIDICIVHIPLELPESLVIGSAIKFALRRLALPARRGYTFSKEMVWDKNLLETHEILQNLKKELINTFTDFNINISIFYGRFNLYYQIFNYINYGIGKCVFIDKHKKLINLKKKEAFDQERSFESHFISFKEGDWFLYYEGEENALKQSIEMNLTIDAQHLITQYKNSTAKPDFLFAIKVDEKFAKLRPLKGKSAKFFSDFAQLVPVRAFVCEICSQVPCQTKNFSHKMQLAIDELFCNIVTHAYNDESKGQIVIEGILSDEGIYFILSDQGNTFDPTLIPFPNFAGEVEGGFGFFIVQQIADHITYVPKKDETDWNRIRIFKRYYANEDPMELSTYIVDNKLIIMPKEENLDAKNASTFKKNFLNILQASQTLKVILDLSCLRFIDSSGLGVLLSLQRVLNKQGGFLKLVHLNKPVQSMFEIVSMHRIFEIFQNVDEAVQSFKT